MTGIIEMTRGTMGQKLSKLGGRYKGSVETFVPLALATGFSVLGLTSHASPKELAAGTLLTLAVLSFALLHEHALRDATELHLGSVDTAMGSMAKLFHELNDPVPYHILRYEAEWEIQTGDGSLARAWQRKLIQFNQNYVMSLWFWASPSGSEDPPVLNKGNVVARIPSPSDEKRKSLVALDKVYKRDEELQFDVARTLHDCFLEPIETVSVTVADSTYFLFIRVTFPAQRRPTEVLLTTGDNGGSGGSRKPLKLEERPDDDSRTFVKIDIPDPPRGVTYTVEWRW